MSLQKKIKIVTREEMRYTKTLRGIGSCMGGTRSASYRCHNLAFRFELLNDW